MYTPTRVRAYFSCQIEHEYGVLQYKNVSGLRVVLENYDIDFCRIKLISCDGQTGEKSRPQVFTQPYN